MGTGIAVFGVCIVGLGVSFFHGLSAAVAVLAGLFISAVGLWIQRRVLDASPASYDDRDKDYLPGTLGDDLRSGHDHQISDSSGGDISGHD